MTFLGLLSFFNFLNNFFVTTQQMFAGHEELLAPEIENPKQQS